MTTIKKDLANKIMVDHRTNLINHLYFMLLKICQLDAQSNFVEKYELPVCMTIEYEADVPVMMVYVALEGP